MFLMVPTCSNDDIKSPLINDSADSGWHGTFVLLYFLQEQ